MNKHSDSNCSCCKEKESLNNIPNEERVDLSSKTKQTPIRKDKDRKQEEIKNSTIGGF